MIDVAVSGAPGRLGRAITNGVAAAEDMRLSGLYAPDNSGDSLCGVRVSGDPKKLSARVVVECAPADAVMENLKTWHEKGLFAVVGTSGFTEERLAELKSFWADDDPGCLIVPNFSVGAVLMMHFAEQAAAFFDSVEIIERHEERKPDAPSGTALATAMRVGRHRDDSGKPEGRELVAGARGGLASGVRVHSLRMRGLLSDQEVAFSNAGETFSLLHRSTSYESFVNGALLAVRHVINTSGVSMGLDGVLGLGQSHSD
jgi:4-hydroxy-tetrahydrodipicolinate reductase